MDIAEQAKLDICELVKVGQPLIGARPKIIQYAGADHRLLHQSILGAMFEDPQFGLSFHHYPLGGGVGIIRAGTFKIVREATDGDIAMALANSMLVYSQAALAGMEGLGS